MNKLATLTACLLLGGAMTLSGQSRLSRAASAGDLAAVKKCIDVWGLGVDDIDEWGWTPLMWAVYYQNTEMTEFLLSQHANPNIQSTMNHSRLPKGSTALMVVGVYGGDDLAVRLLKAGADPNLTNSAKASALSYAKEFQYDSLVELMSKPSPTPSGK